jgi:protein-S-isoprenylcysteine O-methyltransferase Ste14
VVLFLKNLLFTVFVPGIVAGYVPYLLTRNQVIHSGISRFFALIAFLIGVGIYLWCVWDFATFGRGTPAPIDAPKKLVVRGLYRYTRNPMYLGVLTTIIGWSILYHSLNVLLYALLVASFFNLMIFFYEEPHLRKAFGKEYNAYCSKVARWIPHKPKSN